MEHNHHDPVYQMNGTHYPGIILLVKILFSNIIFTNALTGGLWGSKVCDNRDLATIRSEDLIQEEVGRQVIYSQITKVKSAKSALRFVRTLRVGRRGRPMKKDRPRLSGLVIHNHSPKRHFWGPMGDTGEGPY